MADIERGIASAEDFNRACEELGGRLVEVLFAAPKPVAICVLPGVLAAVMRTFDIPRETVIAMLDSALEDING